MNKPLLSIAIPTYKRNDFLKKCVNTILDQQTTDLEILIGNNDSQSTLTSAHFNHSPLVEIRVFNHPENLGQIKNMNFLLQNSRGHYFTWMADDDLYHPQALPIIMDFLRSNTEIHVLFTSYDSGQTPKFEKIEPKNIILHNYSPEFFLESYATGKLNVIGNYGFWDKNHLLKIGGMPLLGSGISPFSDDVLTLKACELKTIHLIHEPLIFFYHHETSMSFISQDSDAYISSAKAFIHKINQLVLDKNTQTALKNNKIKLLKTIFNKIFSVFERGGKFGFFEFLSISNILLSELPKIGVRQYIKMSLYLLFLTVRLKKRVLKKTLLKS